MPPVIRHPPGSTAPWKGIYALVGHYGEATSFSVECQEGAQLPLVPTNPDFGEVWFIFVGEAIALDNAA